MALPERDSVLPFLLEEFPSQFEAVLALDEFAERHRPSAPPSRDWAGSVLMRVYARGSKTFRGSVRLAIRGYGVQAGMLNRSLFEDAIIAHWLRAHPERAEQQMERSIRHDLGKWHAALIKHDRPSGPHLPVLSDDERKQLRREFAGGRTWTGLTLTALVEAVEGEWPAEADRRLLWEIHDFAHLFNNHVLHQTALALRVTANEDDGVGVVRFDVGPSNVHIHGALLGAFWSYANLASLVVTNRVAEELNELYVRHLAAFLSAAEQG